MLPSWILCSYGCSLTYNHKSYPNLKYIYIIPLVSLKFFHLSPGEHRVFQSIYALYVANTYYSFTTRKLQGTCITIKISQKINTVVLCTLTLYKRRKRYLNGAKTLLKKVLNGKLKKHIHSSILQTVWAHIGYFSISAPIVWSNLSQCSCDNPSGCTTFRSKEPKTLAPGHREDHSQGAFTVSKNLVCKQEKESPVVYSSLSLGFFWVRSNCMVRLPREVIVTIPEVFKKHVHVALRDRG